MDIFLERLKRTDGGKTVDGTGTQAASGGIIKENGGIQNIGRECEDADGQL